MEDGDFSRNEKLEMQKILGHLLNLFRRFRLWQLSLRGKTPEDVNAERILNGSAWAEFCDNLKAAGAALVYPGAPRDSFQQAEGVRYLTRMTRAALEAFVEYGDPAYPVMRRMVHETVKMGADNPDNHYMNAQISGDYEYRISGRRNSIHYLGFFTQNGDYGSTGGLQPCGVLEDGALNVEPDGSFEIILSKERKGKNWLKIDEDSSLLMVRQTYLNRDQEVPAELHIQAIGLPVQPHPLTPQRVDQGLKRAGLFVAAAPVFFSRWAKGFKKHTNALPLFDPEISNNAGGDASIIYYHSHWKLARDEALVIETEIPPCDTWNFQLNNYWMESLDYRYFRICISKGNAVAEPDGRIRVIVSHQDPGHPNWIETAGHEEGTMCWRWYRLEDPKAYPGSIPSRVVKLADLR